MRLLITGSGGFLGNHVLNAVSDIILAGHLQKPIILTPNSKNLDLLNPSSVDTFFDFERPDVVLHMAAVCGGILANKNSPADFVHLNNKMTSNLFDAVYKYNPEYVYTLGSVCSYPLHCPTPFQEDDLFNGEPEPTNAPYGQAKRLLFVTQRAYMQQYGLKGAHLIPVNMWGEYDHFDLTNSHVIPAFIRKFYDATENNEPEVRCWGTGEATREFLYAGDCATAIVKAVIERLDTQLPINIGTGRSVSIKELAELIASLVGYQGKIVFTGEVSDGQPKRQLNVERAKDLLGFEAKTSLMTGLLKTICWYQENKHMIKD